jgi:hypothetical protein
MPVAILLSLPATAALFWLLRGYYAKAGTGQASEAAGA